MTIPRSHILIVEDNPADSELLELLLSEATPRPVTAVVRDGEAALAYLRGEAPHETAPVPDLIILDLSLPKLDGREFLDALHASGARGGIPVIVLSTSDAASDITDCYDKGANAYLVKPSGLDELGAMVRSLVSFWLEVATLPERLRLRSTRR